jgi:hypothetical protein
MSILDWLLFDRKGQIGPAAPLAWMAAPTLYFLYAMAAARLGGGIGYDSRYPYHFIDVDVLGWWRVATTGLRLLAGFILLGYVYYAVDRLMARFPGKK